MIVADTNLIASLVLPTLHTATAERLLKREPDWAAPLLWRSELRNVLASSLRLGRIGLPAAVAAVETAEALLEGREFEIPSLPVLRLAEASGCSAYDCEFVALARETGWRLVTLDRKVRKSFPETAVSPSDFLSASKTD